MKTESLGVNATLAIEHGTSRELPPQASTTTEPLQQHHPHQRLHRVLGSSVLAGVCARTGLVYCSGYRRQRLNVVPRLGLLCCVTGRSSTHFARYIPNSSKSIMLNTLIVQLGLRHFKIDTVK